MPCVDGYSVRTVEVRSDNDRIAIEALSERLNKATRLLCFMCNHLEDSGFNEQDFLDMNPELSVWWTDHKRDDKRRSSRE